MQRTLVLARTLAPVLALVRPLALALGVGAVACAPEAPPRFPARPPGCAIETFSVLPQRPYLELETFNLPSPETLPEVLDRVHEPACRDGADAIYAPKVGRSYTYAIALKWQDAPRPAAAPPPVAPPPAAAPPAAAPPPVAPPPVAPPPVAPPPAAAPAPAPPPVA